jgi:rhodanese family protein
LNRIEKKLLGGNMFHFFTKVESISTAELEKRLKTNIKLLDVRTPSEYNRGHIKGALNIPLGQIERYSQSKEEKLYVICHSGVRSRLAAKKLKKKGYDVVNVSGGMMSWKGDVV